MWNIFKWVTIWWCFKGKKGRKTIFSEFQQHNLQEHFQKNAYPTKVEKVSLSKSLDLTTKVIQKWFDNKRTLCKILGKTIQGTPNNFGPKRAQINSEQVQKTGRKTIFSEFQQQELQKLFQKNAYPTSDEIHHSISNSLKYIWIYI